MYFESFSALIAMDGHGPYVWTCYGVAVLILVFNIVSPLRSKKQFLQAQLRRLKRERRLAAGEVNRQS